MGRKAGKKKEVKKIKTAKKSITKQKDNKVISTLKLFWDPVNLHNKQKRERIVALDMCRGYALLGMLLYNIIHYLGTPAVKNESFLAIIYNYWFPFSVVAAFHIMLGIYLVYAQPSIKKLVIRGVQLLILGYLLSIVRYLPLILGTSFNMLDFDNFRGLNNFLDIFILGDIFHYAGLAMMAFALIRKLSGDVLRPVYLLLLATIVYFAPLFSADVMTGIESIDNFWSLFWGGTHVNYPFFPWFSYSLVGASLGCLLIKLKGFKGMEKPFTVTAVSLFLVGIILVDFIGEPSRSFFLNLPGYRVLDIGPEVFIRCVGYYFTKQAIFLWLYKIIPGHFILKTFSFWSKNIMTFYMWHAIALGWIAAIYSGGFRQNNTLETFVIIVIVVVISHYLTKLTGNAVDRKLRSSLPG